jgi:hypothetical protein
MEDGGAPDVIMSLSAVYRMSVRVSDTLTHSMPFIEELFTRSVRALTQTLLPRFAVDSF